MTQATHDLAIKTGEYQSNGQTKGRWLKIGTVFRHDDGGTSIKLDALPVGLPDWGGWVSVFPRDQQQGQGGAAPRQGQNRGAPPPYNNGSAQHGAPADFDDDIPF